MQLRKISASNGSSGRPGRSDQSALSRGEQAYRRLRDAIQTGDLKPGDRLLEVELAKLLGSSRTPVREALGRLESDGLAVRDPHRGMIIAELDGSMIAELYAVREVLEGTAAALAARHASEAEISTLRQIADRDRAFAREPERLAKNNRLFHEALYRSAHNRYLLKTLSALHGSMDLVRTSLAYNERRIELTIEQHQGIVAAIERQDSKAAEEVTRAHIQDARKARLALLLEFHDEIEVAKRNELQRESLDPNAMR
jgi:DNA-binding GntR family transcriptional regulator